MINPNKQGNSHIYLFVRRKKGKKVIEILTCPEKNIKIYIYKKKPLSLNANHNWWKQKYKNENTYLKKQKRIKLKGVESTLIKAENPGRIVILHAASYR